MPKAKPRSIRHVHEDPKGFRLSYATLGAIGTIFVLVIGLWQVASRVATKQDIEAIAQQFAPRVSDTERRVRDIEIQLARQFGASPTSIRPSPSVVPNPLRGAWVRLAQYVQQYPPNMQQSIPVAVPRPIVVPFELIERYKMQPSRGGVYGILGADGRTYSLDDYLIVLTRIVLR